MKRYIVNQPVTLHSGVLELSESQAEVRAHNLVPLGGGRFQIVATVQFKGGESFGFDGDLPKALAALLEPEQPVVKQPSNKKKSESASE